MHSLCRGHRLVCREGEKPWGLGVPGGSGARGQWPGSLQTGLQNPFSQSRLVLCGSPAASSAGRLQAWQSGQLGRCPVLPQFPHSDQNIPRAPLSLVYLWRWSRGVWMKKHFELRGDLSPPRCALWQVISLPGLSFPLCQMRIIVTPTSSSRFEA